MRRLQHQARGSEKVDAPSRPTSILAATIDRSNLFSGRHVDIGAAV
jgi:hypothetical protein